jgi:hypothetical protein
LAAVMAFARRVGHKTELLWMGEANKLGPPSLTWQLGRLHPAIRITPGPWLTRGSLRRSSQAQAPRERDQAEEVDVPGVPYLCPVRVAQQTQRPLVQL